MKKESELIKEANIFLLNLNPSSDLCCALEEILYSVPNIVVHLKRGVVNIGKSSLRDGELCKTISGDSYDLVFIVLPPNQVEQIKVLLQTIINEIYDLPIIVLIDACRPDEMFSLLRIGIADFITPPLKALDIFPRLWRLIDHNYKAQTLTHKLKEKLGLKKMVGESPSFIREIKKVPKVAKCDVSVLISGETGTGKEMCARAIHYLSPRAGGPFVPLNCGAVPTELMENELFGHIQGAFTSASTSQFGLIREADSGTLFLDDVDCLSLGSQVKLLRFLQEKEYRQLGSAKLLRADVRVIASTNTDLEKSVAAGKLRQDLYYRLNVIPLQLPALRDRREDIPLIARHFLNKYAIQYDKKITDFSSGAMQNLIIYDWPGNVRELEHVIERAVLFCEHAIIRNADIILTHQSKPASNASFKEAKAEFINRFEKNYIKGLLCAHHGNITKAARGAQKNRRAFWQLIRKHQINVQTFKSG